MTLNEKEKAAAREAWYALPYAHNVDAAIYAVYAAGIAQGRAEQAKLRDALTDAAKAMRDLSKLHLSGRTAMVDWGLVRAKANQYERALAALPDDKERV
jgi:hypothetical protein